MAYSPLDNIFGDRGRVSSGAPVDSGDPLNDIFGKRKKQIAQQQISQQQSPADKLAEKKKKDLETLQRQQDQAKQDQKIGGKQSLIGNIFSPAAWIDATKTIFPVKKLVDKMSSGAESLHPELNIAPPVEVAQQSTTPRGKAFQKTTNVLEQEARLAVDAAHPKQVVYNILTHPDETIPSYSQYLNDHIKNKVGQYIVSALVGLPESVVKFPLHAAQGGATTVQNVMDKISGKRKVTAENFLAGLAPFGKSALEGSLLLGGGGLAEGALKAPSWTGALVQGGKAGFEFGTAGSFADHLIQNQDAPNLWQQVKRSVGPAIADGIKSIPAGIFLAGVFHGVEAIAPSKITGENGLTAETDPVHQTTFVDPETLPPDALLPMAKPAEPMVPPENQPAPVTQDIVPPQQSEIKTPVKVGKPVTDEAAVKSLRSKLDPENVFRNQVFDEMLSSRPGERRLTDTGEFIGQKSTFPEWVPPELRSTKLFDRAIDVASGSTITSPDTRVGKLVDIMNSEINKRLEITPEMIKSEAGTLAPKKESKIGKSIEAKAVEDRLTKGFGGLAEYNTITIKDQAKRATDLITNDSERAQRIIRGDEALPEGLKGTALITVMEEHIAKTKDVNLAYDLANSPLVSGTSVAAQELRLAAERAPDSATAKLQEIKKARETKTGLKDVNKAKAKAIKELKVETSKINLSKDELSWNKFLSDISC